MLVTSAVENWPTADLKTNLALPEYISIPRTEGLSVAQNQVQFPSEARAALLGGIGQTYRLISPGYRRSADTVGKVFIDWSYREHRRCTYHLSPYI